jgi:demethylmenaquinone methyltransferase/2-methoxy-6-polyprenyl-1,4-benzoquinol methylase
MSEEAIKLQIDIDKQNSISAMFNGIASNYDVANRILSFGQDKIWREKMALLVPDRSGLSMLDVATGTADVIITLCNKCPQIKRAVGVDLALNMLAVGQEKLIKQSLAERVTLLSADAGNLPFQDKTFDLVTVAFGVRNIVAHDIAIKEFFRVLNIGGRLIILEFSMPTNSIISFLYRLYFRHLLPLLGGFLTGDKKAFRYLNKTVEEFYNQTIYKNILLNNGFSNVEVMNLSMGIANIYCAGK